VSRPDRLTAATHRIGSWVVILAGLCGCERRKWYANIHNHVNFGYLFKFLFRYVLKTIMPLCKISLLPQVGRSSGAWPTGDLGIGGGGGERIKSYVKPLVNPTVIDLSTSVLRWQKYKNCWLTSIGINIKKFWKPATHDCMRLPGIAQWNVFHAEYYPISIFRHTHCRILPPCPCNFATYSTQFMQLQKKKLMHWCWGKCAEPWCKVFVVNFRCQISNRSCEYFLFMFFIFRLKMAT
jgi:hypothetical protein